MPEKKRHVSVSKGVHKQNFVTCKSLCNLQELYTAFKEKHQNINIGSQSSVPWDPNGLSWLPEKLLTLYAFVALKKKFMLLVDAMDWDFT